MASIIVQFFSKVYDVAIICCELANTGNDLEVMNVIADPIEMKVMI